MSTLSVPLPADLMEFIETMVRNHKADNKAAVVRNALYVLKEQEAVNALMEAQKDITEGKVFRGNIRDLADTLDD